MDKNWFKMIIIIIIFCIETHFFQFFQIRMRLPIKFINDFNKF